jgi:hypothetical protein
MEKRAQIVVNAGEITKRVSRYTTGACIEDVNHEVYGGIYSQMIFGECFQEPALPPDFRHFHAWQGTWRISDDELVVSGDERADLVARGLELVSGCVTVEMRFAAAADGEAGVTVKVNDPGVRVGQFNCYAARLNPARQTLSVGIEGSGEPQGGCAEISADIPVGKWFTMSVSYSWRDMDVTINGKQVVHFLCGERLRIGGVGLRARNIEAGFRNFQVSDLADNTEHKLPFELADPFQEVSRMWRTIRNGSPRGSVGLERDNPYAGCQSQRISFCGGEGEIGIDNMALNRWGMCLRKAKKYEGLMWVRATEPTDFIVAFLSEDGKTVLARQTLKAASEEWSRLDFSLTPEADDGKGRFAVLLRQPGEIILGYVFLQPGVWGRFKGLPVRKDIAEGLAAHKLTVFRCGGCLVNNPGYLWKDMIGPRDRRRPYHGSWYKYFTHGWGLFDKAHMAEEMGCLYVPSLSPHEKPEDLVDLLDYLNGSTETEWGRIRAGNGHPEPYNLRILEFGNEENVGDVYWQRFKAVADAIWSKDPGIILVVGDLYYGETVDNPDYIEGGERISSLNVRRDIMALAMKYDAEVWFDVHVATEAPDNIFGLIEAVQFFEQIEKVNPGAKQKFAVFEFNANYHHLRRGLANAVGINFLERMGSDRISVITSANCLQPDGQNDHGWDQGLLFFNQCNSWPQPALIVAKMVSENYLPNLVEVTVDDDSRFDVLKAQTKVVFPELAPVPRMPMKGLDISATTDDNRKILVLRVVNVGDDPVPARIALDGFVPSNPSVRITELSGDPMAVNTAEKPDNIAAKDTSRPHGFKDGAAKYTFPASSFTVMRFE